MTVDVFSAFLSYVTVPLYVFGLLFLIYIIARSQLGFSVTGQVKEVVEAEIKEHRPKSKTPMFAYLLVVVMFVLVLWSTIVKERE